ncbi:MAG: C4-dicarboxylate ABC transporter [Bacteroidetes bacterium]|nr:C4-dicarboxylate ABC transporter [Bacteroidota bacterium]
MGLILLVLGAVVAYYKRFGTIDLSLWSAYGLAALMIVYGLFRIWRGVRDFQADQNQNENNS